MRIKKIEIKDYKGLMKTDTFWNAVKQFKTDIPTRCYLAPVGTALLAKNWSDAEIDGVRSTLSLCLQRKPSGNRGE